MDSAQEVPFGVRLSQIKDAKVPVVIPPQSRNHFDQELFILALNDKGSRDSNLIPMLLAFTDLDDIVAIVSRLPSDQIHILHKSVFDIFHQHPQILIWIQAITIAFPEEGTLPPKFQNQAQKRVAHAGNLRKLHGRLQVLLSQIHARGATNDHSESESENETESESESEGSYDSKETSYSTEDSGMEEDDRF